MSNIKQNPINLNEFQANDLILIMKKEQVKKIEKAYLSYVFRTNFKIVVILNRIKRNVDKQRKLEACKSIQIYLRKFLKEKEQIKEKKIIS